jgi:hypothetical protein
VIATAIGYACFSLLGLALRMVAAVVRLDRRALVEGVIGGRTATTASSPTTSRDGWRRCRISTRLRIAPDAFSIRCRRRR